ncbi:formate-dependent phosphoribosylglycinamide formyltransferase [Shewanella sp. NIFS-20-20]|uniref:formate-dependent phosphoribosylglycinamide formyltransferase n=1 Tax=Shewanella sp. NIFS-20-20 TaxID=2853806 RepID=UPI001C43828E|nr:formate-dependent phosphoribosylglycinamide formyltransferase [Shewanella sp. NIFS-20-20]MBV7314442.1 formate-dependent phosphoribosylglycinamide formyltransferase [Shewanella sp. NIFS-20-20]
MLGTPSSPNATRAMLLGSGELGKEVAIELQRFGIEVIAVDRYANAPAMQVAHRRVVMDMLNPAALEQLVQTQQPHIIIPEIEAIATQTLSNFEQAGIQVVPTARATQLTMDRQGIRSLAAETLGLPTSPYAFCDDIEQLTTAVATIGYPCVIKPVMSSSGKGQSLVRGPEELVAAWQYSQQGGRAGEGRVIVEGFVNFDYEITLLTVSAVDGIHFCAPIGHRQEGGDYRESWQPQAMSSIALEKAQAVASTIVTALGGYGLFGVELFIQGDEVFFSEVSPRPHDTGMVTLVSQPLSEFALHVRAILGLPIGHIHQQGYYASAVILGDGTSTDIQYQQLPQALAVSQTQLRLFGKPEINGQRRLGVALAQGHDIEQAVARAVECANMVNIKY